MGKHTEVKCVNVGIIESRRRAPWVSSSVNIVRYGSRFYVQYLKQIESTVYL